MGLVIGRERELQEAADFLAAMDGGPSFLVFEGDAGIGKTVLWEESVARARAMAFSVLTARPTEAEATHAFSVLSDLIEPVVDDVLDDLPSPQQRALAVALLREDPGAAGLERRAVSAATLSVLRALSADARVLIAIDDVQWIDRPSAQAIGSAIRRLAGHGVGIVATERLDGGMEHSSMLEDSVPVDRRLNVAVEPMTVAALHEVLKARLRRSLSRRTLVRIEQFTGGNPFFALEMARNLPDDTAVTTGALPVPASLRDLVGTRVDVLSVAARRSLLAASALRAADVERVRAALGWSSREVRAAFEEAEAAEIIVIDCGQLRFVHPLYAAACYADARPKERRATHKALAAVTADGEERARHLALGADHPDAELADVLESAARDADRRGAPQSAAELVEWALKLTPVDDEHGWQTRAVRAGEHRFHAGDLRSATELLDSVVAAKPSPVVQAQALRILGEIRYTESTFPEAARLFGDALRLVQDDPETEAVIALRLALTLRAMDDFASAETHTRRALALAEQADNPALLAEALALVTRVDFILGRGLDEAALARALVLDDPNRSVAMQMRPRKIAGDLFVYTGQLNRAVRMLDDERLHALERGEDSDLPFVTGHLVWAECWRGNLRRAADLARESLENAERVGGPSECLALSFAALAAAHLGDIAGARSWGERALALGRSTGWHTGVVWPSWALGFLALSVDDPAAADAVLGPLSATVEEKGLVEPAGSVYLADAIEALVALGELDRAHRLAGVFAEAADRVDRRWAIMQACRCRALVHAASGDVGGAAMSIEKALAAAEDVELRFEVARTLLVAGGIDRRRRKKAAACDHIERSKAMFEEAGARLWHDKATVELARATGRNAGLQLTASEDRIGRLAATGLTNREIAAKVFVSNKTVEATLARVYRKLGIRTRAELGARLGRSEETREA